jgi:hypothetical protein
VELYINNVLIDYIQADANGFFPLTLLMYGRTEVSLRYYGPWGETTAFTSRLWFQPYSFKKRK